LLSKAFRAPANRGVLVKSPVDLLVGTVHVFHLPVTDGLLLARLGDRLGEPLFNPPNVKGWPGGNAWITASSLLLRQQLLQRLARVRADHDRGAMMMSSGGTTPLGTAGVRELELVMLPVAPVNPVEPDWSRRRVLRHLLLDPAYQLE
jgi:uncharacterized protein (DUF1800 family)